MKYKQRLLDTGHITGPGWLNNYVVGLPNNSYKLITNTTWVRARFVNYKNNVHSTRSRKW